MEKKIKKNDLGVLVEDTNSKLGLVIEGQSILVKQMKEISKNLNEFKEEMTGFREETNSKFETVFNYLSDNDDMMHQLVGRIDGLEQRIYFLETKVIN